MDILTFAAVVPAVVLLVYVYRLDPIEKEPMGLLLSLLFLGMLSTVPAGLLESLGGGAADDLAIVISSRTSVPPTAVETILLIGLVEETCKFVLLYWRTWRNANFNYVFDGIVYAVFVGLGFAIAENISYVWMYGLGTAFARAFTAIPGHCVFAVFMGYAYGLARRARTRGHGILSVLLLIGAIAVPVLCHGVYDYLAMTGNDGAFWVFLIAFVAAGMLAAKHASRKAQAAA